MAQSTRRQKPSKAVERGFKTKTCNIPSLTQLRKSLGYGHRGEERDIAFKRALTEQVETFVSIDNLPGVSFTKWKTPAHQKGLRDITKNFLFAKRKGPEFWPDDPNSPNKRPLQFPRDFEEIFHLLTKVFYRTAREHKRRQLTASTTQESNQSPKVPSMNQSHSNKNSNEQSSREARRDSRGQSADDPVERGNMQSTTNASAPSGDIDPFAGTSLIFTFRHFMPLEGIPDGIPPTDEPTDEPIDPIREMREDFPDPQPPRDNNSTSNIPSHTTPEDPYRVPNSPTQETQVPRDRGKRPEHPYSIQDVRPAKAPRKDNREAVAGSSASDSSSNNTSTMPSASGSSANVASTSNSTPSSAPTSVPTQRGPPAAPVKKRPYTRHTYKKTRTSARPAMPIHRPDFAREQTMERLIPNSPPSSSSSSEDEEEEEEEENVRGHRVREPALPTVNSSNNTARREDPSGTAPRDNATAPGAKQPSSQARKMGSKKQTSTKKGSMLPPKAPVPQPGSSKRRGPVQESPAGSSTERNSTLQQANVSSTSRTGTHQSQTSQPQTQQNQPPRNNTVPSGERQVIDSTSFFYLRHNGKAFKPWTPSANVFQASLSELMQDLGWDNAQTLAMKIDADFLDDVLAVDVEPGDNEMFNKMRRSFVREMQRCYQRIREPNLEFELRFKPLKV
ncbi:hypothetical protein CEP54_004880 [Fusarium duplospermum]|uniref:Uncharacterized protein n=1 Tax=Fusarium duplospermum TaxID=1325734 RepID=A0A428QFE0_9HYPO|nr:hypothetical protein CEP54_004880 [Fusarium duplospermum]